MFALSQSKGWEIINIQFKRARNRARRVCVCVGGGGGGETLGCSWARAIGLKSKSTRLMVTLGFRKLIISRGAAAASFCSAWGRTHTHNALKTAWQAQLLRKTLLQLCFCWGLQSWGVCQGDWGRQAEALHLSDSVA